MNTMAPPITAAIAATNTPITAVEPAHSGKVPLRSNAVHSLKKEFKLMKFASALLVNIGSGLLTVALASGAVAQAAQPTGVWTTAGNSETLVVQNGYCKLTGNGGQIGAVGSCSWNASAQGGILTIISTLT